MKDQDLIKNFKRIWHYNEYILNNKLTFDAEIGFNCNGVQDKYLNGAFQAYSMMSSEVNILQGLIRESLKKLNKYEKSKSKDDLESLRWTLESI